MQIFSISIISISIFIALLSLFLDFCMREGNILGWWLDFLADLHLPKEALAADMDREDRFQLVDWFWFKPLGGCVVCMSVWIAFIVCACFHQRIRLDLGIHPVLEILAGALVVILLSNFLVRFFQEKIV